MLGFHATQSLRSSYLAVDTVQSTAALRRDGWTVDEIRAQVAARRWQRHGRAILAHNGPPTRAERIEIALINCGRRSVVTSFTAAELLGLQGWIRPAIHILVPAGTRLSAARGHDVVVHYTGNWDAVRRLTGRPIQRLADALVVAAASFATPRPAVGLLAAGVQQRKVMANDLRVALSASQRVRHHAVLLACVEDIAQGSEALSEIDFVALCRRGRLPVPTRQAIRTHGLQRRYLDAEWDLEDGRKLVTEVDGALHLAPQRWYADQLRQNEIALSGALILRFPSVVIRTEPDLVIAQLRRALR